MISAAFETLFVLVSVHFICDYPLQGDFLSRAKKDGPLQAWHLFGHSMIHALGVLIVTGTMSLAISELILHTIIDDQKNRGNTSFASDQALHMSCKISYVFWMAIWGLL